MFIQILVLFALAFNVDSYGPQYQNSANINRQGNSEDSSSAQTLSATYTNVKTSLGNTGSEDESISKINPNQQQNYPQGVNIVKIKFEETIGYRIKDPQNNQQYQPQLANHDQYQITHNNQNRPPPQQKQYLYQYQQGNTGNSGNNGNNYYAQNTNPQSIQQNTPYQYQGNQYHQNSNQPNYYQNQDTTTTRYTTRTRNPHFTGYQSRTTITDDQQKTMNYYNKDQSTTQYPFTTTPRKQYISNQNQNTFGSGNSNNNNNNNYIRPNTAQRYPEVNTQSFTTTTIRPASNTFGGIPNQYPSSNGDKTSGNGASMGILFPDDRNKDIELGTHVPAYLNFDIELTTRAPLVLKEFPKNSLNINPIRSG